MKLPKRCLELLTSDLEPGELYRQCLLSLREEGIASDYALTETIAYATEVRYALQILERGRPPLWHNFGDLQGGADARLWAQLDPQLPQLRIAFVGSGIYPVTAFQIRDRYPAAQITCVENNVVAYLMSMALVRKLGLDVKVCFAHAMDIDYAPFDVVLVAAMVNGKRELVQKILTMSDATILVRGAVDVDSKRVVVMDRSFGDDGSLGSGGA
jgi:hypothetical protein